MAQFGRAPRSGRGGPLVQIQSTRPLQTRRPEWVSALACLRNMRKPLSRGMTSQDPIFQLGPAAFPAGRPARMLVSRRSPGKLISAGSWRGMLVRICRRALPHFDSPSGAVVSKNLGVFLLGRGRPAAHRKSREPAPAMRRSAGPPGGKAMSRGATRACPRRACRSPRPSRRARGPPPRWRRTGASRRPSEPRGGARAWRSRRRPCP